MSDGAIPESEAADITRGNIMLQDTVDPGNNIAKRAYKVRNTGVTDEGEQYDFSTVVMYMEVPMPNGNKWGQRQTVSLGMWEDESARDWLWGQMYEAAIDGIQTELGG